MLKVLLAGIGIGATLAWAVAKSAKENVAENEKIKEAGKKVFDDSVELGKNIGKAAKSAFNDAKEKFRAEESSNGSDITDDIINETDKESEESVDIENYSSEENTEDKGIILDKSDEVTDISVDNTEDTDEDLLTDIELNEEDTEFKSSADIDKEESPTEQNTEMDIDVRTIDEADIL